MHLPACFVLLFVSFVLGMPTIPVRSNGRLRARAAFTQDDIASQIQDWQSDTMIVSQFLDTPLDFSGSDASFKASAFTANFSEVNELTHKLILDEFLAPEDIADVNTANTTLFDDGTFQFVVDGLGMLAMGGLADIDLITMINQDRCVNVLPSIDEYFAAAASAANAGLAGAVTSTLDTLSAIRPTACSSICATASCTLPQNAATVTP